MSLSDYFSRLQLKVWYDSPPDVEATFVPQIIEDELDDQLGINISDHIVEELAPR